MLMIMVPDLVSMASQYTNYTHQNTPSLWSVLFYLFPAENDGSQGPVENRSLEPGLPAADGTSGQGHNRSDGRNFRRVPGN